MRREEITARLPTVFEYAELADVADQPVGTYSAGMRARLGFAVALEADPDVLLIDEVLGVGDAEFRRKSATTLRERIRSQRTVVLVSHSAGLVGELCDRAVWIDRGRVREVGATKQVLAHYHASSKGDLAR
jgi:lipopolysaccharide transport system ATP-binding protein